MGAKEGPCVSLLGSLTEVEGPIGKEVFIGRGPSEEHLKFEQLAILGVWGKTSPHDHNYHI